MNEWTKVGQGRLATARARHNEALDCLARSDSRSAVQLLTEAHRIRRCVVPAHHPLCIATLDLLVSTVLSIGDLERGKTLLLELHENQVLRLGSFHPETEATAQRLAGLCQRLGDHKLAEQFTAEVWKIRTASRSEQHAADFDRLLALFPLPEHFAQRAPQVSVVGGHVVVTGAKSANEEARLIRQALDERVAKSSMDRAGALNLSNSPGAKPSQLDPELAKLIDKSKPSAADVLLATGSPPPREAPPPNRTPTPTGQSKTPRGEGDAPSPPPPPPASDDAGSPTSTNHAASPPPPPLELDGAVPPPPPPIYDDDLDGL